MSENASRKSAFQSVATRWLCPPIALVRVWRDSSTSLFRKVLSTLGLTLYSVVYAALIVTLLIQVGCVSLEWKGGFPPVLTFHKTVPDYEALEEHRQHASPPSATNISQIALSAEARTGSPVWTGFRGADRSGHYNEMPIRTDWPVDGLKPLWRQPIGGGYGSFAMAYGLAYTIEQRRELEAVTAYEILTGREVWVHEYPARFEESMGGEGPRSTPTWDDGKLYSLGAMGDFYCLDAITGDVLWHHQLLREHNAQNLFFGCSASPLIVQGRVIVVGGEGAHTLFAYDKLSGQLIWQSVSDKPAYVSPLLVSLAGRVQLLMASASHAMGVDPNEGMVLWKYPWEVQHDLTIAQPVIVNSNRFALSSGYNKGAALIEVRETERGLSAEKIWSSRFLKNKFTSSVLHEGYLYGLDESILTCLDAATGERQWKDGRYGYGQLVLASGHLIILSGEGDLVLVRASPEKHEEIASFPAITGKTWNHPALSGGYLLIRNAVEMACFDLGIRRGQ